MSDVAIQLKHIRECVRAGESQSDLKKVDEAIRACAVLRTGPREAVEHNHLWARALIARARIANAPADAGAATHKARAAYEAEDVFSRAAAFTGKRLKAPILLTWSEAFIVQAEQTRADASMKSALDTLNFTRSLELTPHQKIELAKKYLDLLWLNDDEVALDAAVEILSEAAETRHAEAWEMLIDVAENWANLELTAGETHADIAAATCRHAWEFHGADAAKLKRCAGALQVVAEKTKDASLFLDALAAHEAARDAGVESHGVHLGIATCAKHLALAQQSQAIPDAPGMLECWKRAQDAIIVALEIAPEDESVVLENNLIQRHTKDLNKHREPEILLQIGGSVRKAATVSDIDTVLSEIDRVGSVLRPKYIQRLQARAFTKRATFTRSEADATKAIDAYAAAGAESEAQVDLYEEWRAALVDLKTIISASDEVREHLVDITDDSTQWAFATPVIHLVADLRAQQGGHACEELDTLLDEQEYIPAELQLLRAKHYVLSGLTDGPTIETARTCLAGAEDEFGQTVEFLEIGARVEAASATNTRDADQWKSALARAWKAYEKNPRQVPVLYPSLLAQAVRDMDEASSDDSVAQGGLRKLDALLTRFDHPTALRRARAELVSTWAHEWGTTSGIAALTDAAQKAIHSDEEDHLTLLTLGKAARKLSEAHAHLTSLARHLLAAAVQHDPDIPETMREFAAYLSADRGED